MSCIIYIIFDGSLLFTWTVHEPALIRAQMDFSSLVMMKMFLGAMASSEYSMLYQSVERLK